MEILLRLPNESYMQRTHGLLIRRICKSTMIWTLGTPLPPKLVARYVGVTVPIFAERWISPIWMGSPTPDCDSLTVLRVHTTRSSYSPGWAFLGMLSECGDPGSATRSLHLVHQLLPEKERTDILVEGIVAGGLNETSFPSACREYCSHLFRIDLPGRKRGAGFRWSCTQGTQNPFSSESYTDH